jgi:hypothetical protein
MVCVGNDSATPQSALTLPALMAEQMAATGFHILEFAFLREAKPFRNRFLCLVLHNHSHFLRRHNERLYISRRNPVTLSFLQKRNGAFYVRNPAASSSFKRIKTFQAFGASNYRPVSDGNR